MSTKKKSKNLEDLLLDDLSKASATNSDTANEVTSTRAPNEPNEIDGLDPNLWRSGHEDPKNTLYDPDSLWEFEKSEAIPSATKKFPKEVPAFEGSDPDAHEKDLNKTYQIKIESSAEEQKTHVVPATDHSQHLNPDATVAVPGLSFQSAQPQFQKVKVAVGQNQGVKAASGQIFTSADASLLQADNLRLAQQRILDLEKEIDQLRYENDQLGSAGDIVRQKYEELTTRNFQLEKERNELRESFQTEISILKGKVDFRDMELVKAKNKVDEFEQRLKQDFKKIRVREKELENRVELMKLEQTALVKSKDEQILDLKRKLDRLEDDMEVYRSKVFETNKIIENQQEQFKRAIRALRVAFSSLEGHGESTPENIVSLKKAE